MWVAITSPPRRLKWAVGSAEKPAKPKRDSNGRVRSILNGVANDVRDAAGRIFGRAERFLSGTLSLVHETLGFYFTIARGTTDARFNPAGNVAN
jgi:hypothetical protein